MRIPLSVSVILLLSSPIFSVALTQQAAHGIATRIILSTDAIHAEAISQADPRANPDTIVYVTKTGAKYHGAGCRSLSKSAIPMPLKEAAKKYGPCSVCKPPTMGTASPASPSATPSAQAPRMSKAEPADNGDVIVYVTRTGAKYHRAGCSSLAKSSIPMPLRDAAARYGPCSICKPPILAKYAANIKTATPPTIIWAAKTN